MKSFLKFVAITLLMAILAMPVSACALIEVVEEPTKASPTTVPATVVPATAEPTKAGKILKMGDTTLEANDDFIAQIHAGKNGEYHAILVVTFSDGVSHMLSGTVIDPPRLDRLSWDDVIVVRFSKCGPHICYTYTYKPPVPIKPDPICAMGYQGQLKPSLFPEAVQLSPELGLVKTSVGYISVLRIDANGDVVEILAQAPWPGEGEIWMYEHKTGVVQVKNCGGALLWLFAPKKSF